MNSAAKALGLGPLDRAVIIHADDVGMCEASVSAFMDLAETGLISSASLMAPCPWFLTAAAFCRAHPAVDVGVHLTLTSEWQHYRWRPLASLDPELGLVDAQGCFHRTRHDLHRSAKPCAVYAEMKAQLEAARREGLDVTHLDTHMFSALHPKLLPEYSRLAFEARLPALLWFQDGKYARLSEETDSLVGEAGVRGLPIIDHTVIIHSNTPGERAAQFLDAIARLRPGVTHLLLHPSKDTPELRAIVPDWRERVVDYEVMRSPELRNFIRDSGVHVIGYRPLREAFRGIAGAASGSA
jgi:predicted glycoside hydrolase/deacetylase ChbG (UPF0249 family)